MSKASRVGIITLGSIFTASMIVLGWAWKEFK